jgi:DNA-binding PadR family transcriptional regulator
LSLASLDRKGLVEACEQTDDFGHSLRAYRVTDTGTAWLLENEHKLRMREGEAPSESVTEEGAAEVDDEDIPF